MKLISKIKETIGNGLEVIDVGALALVRAACIVDGAAQTGQIAINTAVRQATIDAMRDEKEQLEDGKITEEELQKQIKIRTAVSV